MDKLRKFSSDLTTYAFFWIFIANTLGIGVYLLMAHVLGLKPAIAAGIAGFAALMTSIGISKLVVLAATQPLKAVWQAVWHISPTGTDVEAPNLETLTHGFDLAKSVVGQIYDMSGGGAGKPKTANSMPDVEEALKLLEYLPLPVVALDAEGNITAINKLAATYIGRTPQECLGKSFDETTQLLFAGNETLEAWLNNTASKSVTANSSWDRVRLQLPEEKGIRQFDLIARYAKNDPNHYETMLAFFDHTDKYQTEDNSAAYVALAVHELRTPLTVLRGYIEVFEDELGAQLTPELKDFMHKMSASAQTLTAFVSNILNVARVDENQLSLSLHEAKWPDLLTEICKNLELRVKVRGKKLLLDIAPDLPTVAVDKVSIYEVISNLVENAVKYSDEGTAIVVHAQVGKNGNIETVVEDHGVGIPESAVKNLFTKFYRSHRSKGTVSGSGLGLYLVKAIVTAHGGQVWVQSKEGEGSSFGFSLQPYASVASQLQNSTDGTIERQAHGWIKNHSMYRR